MSHTSTTLSSGGAAAIGGTTVPPATPVDSFSEQLAERLGKHSALPYLFVGSGLSRRYLGLPDWRGMLTTFADDLSVNFDYLLASADGDLPQAAGLLAAAFHEPWWQDARYKTQRELHASDVKDKEGALKVAVAEYFRERSALQAGSPGVDDGGLALEIATLRDAVIDGIITTNYDNLTDEVFPEFKDYVGQDDLILSDAQFVAEVYKIHGSCEKPASLVLTKRDYEQYHQRNAYLAAKLLTIFAEHPVIFLGYSLGDGYIREIIENIAMAVGPSRLDRLQSQIYFVEWNPNPQVLPSLSPFFIDLHQQGHSLPAMRIETNTYLPIFQALTALQRPFPIQVLRQLKEHVYNLVSHPDPDQALETVRAIPFDSAETGDYRVVFGVGSFTDQDLQDISGLSGRVLTRLDLARDLLGIRERRIVAKNVLYYGLPEILKHSSNAFVPVYKYLVEAGFDGTEDGAPDDLHARVKSLLSRNPQPPEYTRVRFEREVDGRYRTPSEVMESDLPRYFKFDCLLLLDPAGYPIEDLQATLVREFGQIDTIPENEKTPLFKVMSHYDRLKYRSAENSSGKTSGATEEECAAG